MLDPTCRWSPARTLAPNLSRERRGSHPRDGRVPASSEPTAEVRIGSLGDSDAPNRDNPSSSSGRRPEPPPVDDSADSPAVDNDLAERRHRSSRGASGPAGPRRRDAEAQVSEGGLGVGGAAAMPTDYGTLPFKA